MKSAWNALNGTGKAAIGALIAALLTIFALISGNPFALKSEVAAMKADLQRELTDMRADLREIRKSVEIIRHWTARDGRPPADP